MAAENMANIIQKYLVRQERPDYLHPVAEDGSLPLKAKRDDGSSSSSSTATTSNAISSTSGVQGRRERASTTSTPEQDRPQKSSESSKSAKASKSYSLFPGVRPHPLVQVGSSGSMKGHFGDVIMAFIESF